MREVGTSVFKRMICISFDTELRVSFIKFAKGLFDKAKEVLEHWRQGRTSTPFPSGLFPPPFPVLANYLKETRVVRAAV